MSENIVEITNSDNHTINIETNLEHNNNVVIELNNPTSIDVINNTTVLVGDLPQGYPLSWTSENLPISRVSGILGLSGIRYNNGIFSLSGIPLEFLPVKYLNAGSGIGIINNSGIFDIAVTGTFGLTGEQVDDRVSNLLLGTNYISFNYDDHLDKLIISVTGLQPSGDYSFEGHQHIISDIFGLQNSLDSKQPSGVYASGIHNHISSDITDFSNSVSGLLPSIIGSEYIKTNFNNNQYILFISGLQPSGNYSLIGHHHLSNDISDFTSAVSGLFPIPTFTSLNGVSGVVVTHNGSDYIVGLSNPSILLSNINDLSNEALSFLLSPSSNNLQTLITNETGTGSLVFNTSPNFSGIPTAPTANSGNNSTQIANTAFVRTEISNLVNSSPSTLDTLNELATALGNDPNFSTTITNSLSQKANLSGANFTGNISGPNGDFSVLKQNGIMVSVSGHSHISSDITNFNSSVSGLLPVTNIIGGTNINVVPSGSSFTVSVSGQLGLTAEEVDDRVSNLLIAGTGITLFYNDNLNSLSIATTGLQPSGNYSFVGHTHTSNNITDFTTAVSGIVNSGISTSLAAGTGIALEYFAATDTLLISTSGVSLVGHKHVASEINDFDAAVKLIKLNDLAVPTGTVNFNNQRLINVGVALSGTDGINKNYIDNLLATTGIKGIASFDSGDFNVTSGVVSIKTSGIDNSQLVYSNIVLGSTTLALGSTYLSIAGLTIDGGSP